MGGAPGLQLGAQARKQRYDLLLGNQVGGALSRGENIVGLYFRANGAYLVEIVAGTRKLSRRLIIRQ